MNALEGKLALVAGASGEIGSAVARRLARDGAHAVVFDCRSDRSGADAVVRAIVAGAAPPRRSAQTSPRR